MDIARQKRDENVAEYVLYIWQLEDLLRALQFSPEAVFTALIAPRDASDEWKLAALEWYMDIANLLQKEGKAEAGHLDHTLHIIADLNDLHLTLLEQPVGRRYRELVSQLAPSLPRLRETLGRDVSDIELAFRALYAAMLYRIRETAGATGSAAEITTATDPASDKTNARMAVADEAVASISPVIALLCDIYHKVERGEIDIYKE